jgi:hypothetical protein
MNKFLYTLRCVHCPALGATVNPLYQARKHVARTYFDEVSDTGGQ